MTKFNCFSQLRKSLHEWRLRCIFASCLRALRLLQQAYSACYVQLNYVSKQPSYEKIISQKRAILLSKIEHARNVLKKNKNVSKKQLGIFCKIEHLSEIIFSLNQLRFRVSGHAIFEVCLAEMRILAEACRAILKKLGRSILWGKQAGSSIELLDAIHAFEAISQRTLQVASPEPIVFSFFIQDLYALYDEVNDLS